METMGKVAKTGKKVIKKLSEVHPHPKNVKLHPQWQIEKLGQLIDDTGYDQIIVIDEKDTILKGAGRWLALKDRGYDSAEMELKTGLSEDQKLALIIADNKIISQMYDNKILAKELPRLAAKGLETMWNEKEIRELNMKVKEDASGIESSYDLSPQLFEHYNYILLFFKDEKDFKFAKQLLDLKTAQDRMKPDKVGILREVPGIEAMEKIMEYGRTHEIEDHDTE